MDAPKDQVIACMFLDAVRRSKDDENPRSQEWRKLALLMSSLFPEEVGEVLGRGQHEVS